MFALLVLLYSAFPIYFATRATSMRLVFLYVYISIVHVVGGFLGAVVAFPLAEGVTISGGSLAYGAFMMSTVVLVIVGRDLQVVRNVIKLVVATNIFKFALFSLTSSALGSADFLNPFETSPLVFQTSLSVVTIGGGLIILELLLLVGVFEKVKNRVKDPRSLAALYVLFFIVTLCLDGVLFPPLAFPSDPALGSLVAAGLQAKFVLACAFAIPLIGFLIAFRSNLVSYEMTPLRLTELFSSPREELVEEIGRQQAEIEASEQSYQQLAESIGDYLFTLDRQMTITYWNEAAERTGYLKEDVVGKRYADAFPDRDLLPFFAKALQTQTSDRIVHEVERDGRTYIFDVSVFPYKQGLTVLARDITEVRRSQDRRMQSQKMEAIGQLAGGVAHDFNNLLSVINNYAAFVHDGLAPDDPNREDIEEVMKAGQRARDLVRQLLTFSRTQEVETAPVSLRDVLQQMAGLLKRTIPESIEMVVDLGSDPYVEIDRTQLEQAVLNLVLNARDAMPSGGCLTIAVSETMLDDAGDAALGLPAGPYALIRVHDTGSGMSPEVAKRIFEPFFTTKERGAGTGLGLAGVYGTVSRAGGHVAVSTVPDEGSTFDVFLPLATPDDGVAGSSSIDDEAHGRAHGGSRILVAEDEEMIRRIVERILTAGGFEPIVAASATDALRILDSDTEQIDLLLTDVVMPELTGTELAQRAREKRPELRVLYMTGHADDVRLQHGLSHTAAADILMKPFTAEELTTAVVRSLERISTVKRERDGTS